MAVSRCSTHACVPGSAATPNAIEHFVIRSVVHQEATLLDNEQSNIRTLTPVAARRNEWMGAKSRVPSRKSSGATRPELVVQLGIAAALQENDPRAHPAYGRAAG
jgi:hypothetical protein